MKVMIVEDDPVLRRNMTRQMSDYAEVVFATGSAAEAASFFQVHRGQVDVVVTDVDLDDGDGIRLISIVRALDPAVGAVLATGADVALIADQAVELGVQGYLLKPFDMSELMINTANAGRWRQLERENAAHRERLESLVKARTKEVQTSRWETIRRLAIAAEYRDPETANHLDRMSSYAAILARRAGLSPLDCEEIRLASPMHDIGKMGIPDSILTYAGVFDEYQRVEMKRHAEIGYAILSGSDASLLETAAVIALTHHEWWDGSGYPRGLHGTQIPLAGRIVAIADVFDALTAARRYKPAYSVDQALSMMSGERGTHFDPELLDLFTGDLADIALIRDAFSEEPFRIAARVS